MKYARVTDSRGFELAPCPEDRARELMRSGPADCVSEDPLTIRLRREINLPQRAPRASEEPLHGKRVLLHICCGPCATYTVRRLREVGAEVTGYWFNPNIHPFSEHEKRRETVERYGQEISLPLIIEPAYEMPIFFQLVVGHERFRERCLLCYQLRLERTAQVAAMHGYDAFTTTLLISPYQDQAAIHRIGDEAGAIHGVAFYFENLRRGFAEHHQLAREHGLYQQRYCGCLYSEWEAIDRNATTHQRG